MKRKARRLYYSQRQWRVTRRGAIQKKANGSGATRGVVKPTYFSLLADVEYALKVEHTKGASLLKLKRELEQKYGGKKFDTTSNRMLQSAVKRLRNRGRIAKIHPNSTLFRFKPRVVPSNYNFFGPGPTHSRVPPPMGAKLTPRKQSMLMSRSKTMPRSTTRGSGSQSTTQGSMSTRSRSPSNSIVKPTSRALNVRKLESSAKRKRVPIRRR